MQNKTPVELLDDILNYLKENEFKISSLNSIEKDLLMQRDFLHTLLLVLKSDGYIIMKNFDEICLTPIGYVFQALGSYKSMIQERVNNLKLVEDNRLYHQDTDKKILAAGKRLNILTFWVALGTISLSVFELLKFLGIHIHFR